MSPITRKASSPAGTTPASIGVSPVPVSNAIAVNGEAASGRDSRAPFALTPFSTATGETPMLAGVLPVGDSGYLVIGDKGADLYRPQ